MFNRKEATDDSAASFYLISCGDCRSHGYIHKKIDSNDEKRQNP
jgi:hypothetical protein